MAPSAPVLVLLSLLARPATGTAASPRAPAPFHLELEAPAGCTSTEAVVRNVETRLGRARRARSDEPGRHFKLRISRAGARVRGVLSVVDERGETEDRTVEGASCDEIVEALSLTMALALSAESKPPQPPPARVSDGPPRSPRPRPGPSSRSQATASGAAPSSRSPATPTAAPAPAASPAAGATPPTPRPADESTTSPPPSAAATPVAEPATPAPPPPPPPPEAPPAIEAPSSSESPRPPSRLTIGAMAVGAQPVSPPISWGGALSLAVAWPNSDGTSLGWAPTHLGISLIHVANNYLQSPTELVARWTAVALGACAPLGLGGRIELHPCGRATAGWLSASYRSIANPTPVGHSWFSLGVLLRLSIPVGGGFAVEASGGAEFPLLERRFIITSPDTSPDTPVGGTPRAAGWAGLGLTRSL